MSNPFPLDGSYISNKYGIYIIAKRNADVVSILNRAMNFSCFVFSGEYSDVFRIEERDGLWYCETVAYSRLNINEFISERFCRLYGLEWREDFSE